MNRQISRGLESRPNDRASVFHPVRPETLVRKFGELLKIINYVCHT